MTEHRLLCTKEVADILGFSVSTIERWRAEEKGPSYVCLEGNVRYELEEVYEYKEERKVRRSGK
jgi:predicted DNA-binding transcriptional regulator AlpA